MELTITDNEEKEAREFYEKHKDCCRKVLKKEFFSTTGGGFSYIITPTGLGNCVSIRCNSCGEIEDITDSENW